MKMLVFHTIGKTSPARHGKAHLLYQAPTRDVHSFIVPVLMLVNPSE